MTTGSLVAELGLPEYHLVGVLRCGLDVNYPCGLISTNWRSLYSIDCINSDTQVVDPRLAQVPLKDLSLWSVHNDNFIIWCLATCVSIELLLLFVAYLRAECGDVLLMHFPEPSVLRFILTSDPISVLADVVGVLLFREHWRIQLPKSCGQLGRVRSREAPVVFFQCWLNTRDLPSLILVERPGLA